MLHGTTVNIDYFFLIIPSLAFEMGKQLGKRSDFPVPVRSSQKRPLRFSVSQNLGQTMAKQDY